MMKLLEYIKSNRLYLDGAMGSELIAQGLDTNNAELFNITEPERIRGIHRKYLAAGSRLIYTNTFGANARKLGDAAYPLADIITAGVENARSEADHYNAYVAYDAGPLGELLEPYSSFTAENCYELYAEQAKIVNKLPVDCVVIETVTDSQELRQAILAFREHTLLPVFCSMSFSLSGRTFTGCSVAAFINIAQSLGVSAAGINCSLGADGMAALLPDLIRYAHVPLFIKPNAGLPVYVNGKTCYDTDAEAFSDYMVKIASAGISILGGCCGTTPEYMERTIQKTEKLPFTLFQNHVPCVCSASKVVDFSAHRVMGERVNPTGKPLLKQAMLREDYDYIASLAREQAEDGADILDLNAGMSGIDEQALLTAVIKKVQSVVDLPLQIDSVKIQAAESALRVLNGVGIINSVNAEQASLNAVLPVAAKYGAYLVGLCLNENGIPQTAEGRVDLARKIIEEAAKYGIEKYRILIDPLTMAVSVDSSNALITLQTMQRVQSELGVKTVVGLSNVSFGLPRREIINAAFYRMALEQGLSAAIINPKLKAGSAPEADEVLRGRDEGCVRYIARFSGETETKKEEKSFTVEDCILRGLRQESQLLVKRIATAENYTDVINSGIIPSLNKLGELYDAGKAFLPQLIAGAEAAKVMLNYIREHYLSEADADGDVMLVATVKGDIHDIGKNIVKAVLANYGYRIYDLGKDVPIGSIIEAAKKYKPKYIGLSALMTTTLDNMEKSVRAIKEYDPRIVVLVGGAVVTQEFADSIGADIYSRDAQDAVNRLKALEGKNGER